MRVSAVACDAEERSGRRQVQKHQHLQLQAGEPSYKWKSMRKSMLQTSLSRIIELYGESEHRAPHARRHRAAGFALIDALCPRTPKGSTILIRETSMVAA